MKYLSSEEVDLLRHNARTVVRELGLLNDAYFDIGVTLAERHLLIELCTCLYPTVGEIAERLLLDKSTASRLISKAVKKGYIKCSSDAQDKRKRYIQFTKKGKEILHAFEPIAFNQTKDALLVLTEEERAMVSQGVALYAKGLKISRIRKKITFTRLKEQDNAALAELLTDFNKAATWADLFQTPYFVMKIDKEVIGAVCISHSKNASICALSKLCIRSDMRELEMEKYLLECCLKEAKKLKASKCVIDTEKENLFPLEFFQKEGFQQTKNHESLLWKAC